MAVDETSGPEGAGATLVGASCAMLVAVVLLGEQDGLPGLTFNGALVGVTLGSGTAMHGRPWLLGAIVALSAMRYGRKASTTVARCGGALWFADSPFRQRVAEPGPGRRLLARQPARPERGLQRAGGALDGR